MIDLTHPPNPPLPPYDAVIFTSQRTAEHRGYEKMTERMVGLAAGQPGFLGVEGIRGESGLGITLPSWESLEAISGWKRHAEHLTAQQTGREVWYSKYEVRIAKVERAYGMRNHPDGSDKF